MGKVRLRHVTAAWRTPGYLSLTLLTVNLALFPLSVLWTPGSLAIWTLAWRVIRLVWLPCPQSNSQVTLEHRLSCPSIFFCLPLFPCGRHFFKNPLNWVCENEWQRHLPTHHVGGSTLLPRHCTQRNDASNYICPVWMCPSAPPHGCCLWCSRLRFEREESEGARAFFSPCCLHRAKQGRCCWSSDFHFVVWLGGGPGKEERGVSWKQMRWGGRQPTLQLRNETFYGLTCSEFKGCVRENCRCWFRGIWSSDEKRKANKLLGSTSQSETGLPVTLSSRSPPAVGPRRSKGGGQGQREQEEGP